MLIGNEIEKHNKEYSRLICRKEQIEREYRLKIENLQKEIENEVKILAALTEIEVKNER